MNSNPTVSVVVPLYNREKFLPQLAQTMESQTFRDFELILINDGSSDGTAEWIQQNKNKFSVPVIYREQENAGPYAARNHGLKLASGNYIAFQDSDDEWPDYHLQEFVQTLEENPDIDWLFGSLTRIDHDTREVVEATNFVREDNSKHPFVMLSSDPVKGSEMTKIVNDPKAGETAIVHSVPGSTQCALIRREVFKSHLFDESFRTAYDRFYAIKLVLLGYNFAFTERTHQIYHIHDSHISLVTAGSTQKRERSALTMIKGYQGLSDFVSTPAQKKAISQRLAKVYAWELSMACQEMGEYKNAMRAMMKAVYLSPGTWLYWRSLSASLIRFFLRR
ncbi:glycosyltransferase family 2 protein [Alteromonas antoniana]|uniref:glycosyltransferase family 2 protein n=1 Tax=Alteromonas antoniana TaxID=2803813 RepID=UPI001C437A7D|nr:glycosyltransferase family 2 protein [Alteromonas antoniana]